ncbi:ArsC family reductase [Marinomonas transparens]|uniref:ArsC family reductase n=1 Tax=Marinomonas transparens TaxID=2795388 RepID=A0A934MWP4_9GAMM|nr:ArsC family reductase [Marinomonas transparens]MBJ7538389.1 ArsC family reductase [Marinomonas transparens]
MIKIYGIKNCDTMKKAFRWLDDNKIEYVFHDYKKDGLDESKAKAWIEQLGWETVINKRGTTWRKLEDDVKISMDNEKAVATIVNQTSMIKRPLIEVSDQLILGFNTEDYSKHLI